jgi:3-methyladenine DNA glycosylase AlkC
MEQTTSRQESIIVSPWDAWNKQHHFFQWGIAWNKRHHFKSQLLEVLGMHGTNNITSSMGIAWNKQHHFKSQLL